MIADLKKRHDDVLAIIVSRYIETAEPVGSRFVSRKLGLSSATIRNVMADLEDMGYITHPHTSAGRMPTDKGYRYYINSLMRVRGVSDNMIRAAQIQYHQALRSLEDVLESTSHLISSLTNYVGITVLSQYEKLYMDGASHILEQPEFRNIGKLHELLKCLEEKKDLFDLLSRDVDDDRLTIYIGKESHSSHLKDCSIVTRGYKVRGKTAGRLGVIGPKRMMYERVIPAVEYLAETVTTILEEMKIEPGS
ncbi:MAG: heat-inducible transcriptional repressor HrcA [Candidatus Omnitrophica bacterium]|nr:heat-inducible transcriptional repressor HrcA [Candidatus Omnitrophota bacterium]